MGKEKVSLFILNIPQFGVGAFNLKGQVESDADLGGFDRWR